MTNIKEKLDFKGQTLSIGLDVHLKSWSVSLYFGGHYLKSFTQPPNVEALVSYVHNHYPNANYQCAYESGFCGFWIQRALQAKNINCIVVNAADIPQTDKSSKNKNDKNDSKRIALSLQSGQLSAIHVPDEELEADRQLVRCNNKYNQDLTRIKKQDKRFIALIWNRITCPVFRHIMEQLICELAQRFSNQKSIFTHSARCSLIYT